MRKTTLWFSALLFSGACTGDIMHGQPRFTDGTDGGGGAGGSTLPPGSDGGGPRQPDVVAPPLPGQEACNGPVAASPASILTALEFRNSLRDLLGLTATELGQLSLPLSVPVKGLGFDNDGDAHSFNGVLDKYFESSYAAAKAAGQRMDPSSCRTGETQPACAGRLLKALATLAYRRPVDAATLSKLTGFFGMGATFQEGMTNAIRAVLISPRFLIKERFGATGLDSFDIAQRLSFFLWRSVPDQPLMDKASAGTLTNPAMVSAEVTRMLASPRAASYESDFANQWLDLDTVAGSTDPILAAAATETQLFFKDVRANLLPFNDLFTANYTYVNNKVASQYGLTQTSPDFQKMSFVPANPRTGVLTQTAVLTSANRGTVQFTSPIFRGLFVRMKFLCSRPPEPPENTVFPDLSQAGVNQSIREMLAKHEQPGTACYACHTQMDPYGWPLEFYDSKGLYRTQYNAKYKVDGSTMIPELGNKPILNATELAAALADTTATRSCIVEKHARFAVGRQLSANDLCHVRNLSKALFARPVKYSDLVAAIVSSPVFLEK
jgi:hypothetical protein